MDAETEVIQVHVTLFVPAGRFCKGQRVGKTKHFHCTYM